MRWEEGEKEGKKKETTAGAGTRVTALGNERKGREGVTNRKKCIGKAKHSLAFSEYDTLRRFQFATPQRNLYGKPGINKDKNYSKKEPI